GFGIQCPRQPGTGAADLTDEQEGDGGTVEGILTGFTGFSGLGGWGRRGGISNIQYPTEQYPMSK
ncbi:MAG: hypothetical protein PHR34_03985, partial [Kiritimatiellae bacterium]|nr:hypothetical protein [Kiritimatiellia bacterium]